MRLRWAALTAGVALAVTMGAAACGGTHSPQLSARGQQLTRILAGLTPKSVSDQFELDLAARQQQLDVSCMATHHLRYLARDPHDLIDTTTETDFTSVTYAGTYGFGVTTFPHLTGADPNAATLSAFSPAQRTEFTNQLSICDDAANRQADREFEVAAANEEFARSDQAVRQDSRYRDALTAWRTCAAAAGYHQSDRKSLIEYFRHQMDTIRDDLSAAAARSGSPGDATMAAIATNDPAFQQLHQREVAAAVSTFPCSQRQDATYRSVYESYASHS